MELPTLLPDRTLVMQLGRRIRRRLPESRTPRVAVGILFVVGGVVSFLPLLGVWMLPVGFLILSIDFPKMRRLRRIPEVRVFKARVPAEAVLLEIPIRSRAKFDWPK